MADGSVTSSSPTSTQLPDWPLRRPASRRISNPVSLRLQTITETINPNAPPIPPRSTARDSGSSWSLPQHEAPQSPPSREGRRSTDRPGTAPPAYEWVPDPNPADAHIDGRAPVEGEKLAKLRRGGGHVRQNRGGMKRLFLILALLLVIIVGLAVGLGVGLTVGRSQGNGNQQSDQPNGTNPSTGQQNEPFPLGEYSMVTALQTVSTNCTSNAATWSCYPYSTYSPSDSSSSLNGRSVYNWAIAQTGSNYATINTGSTPDAGIPANLTISATDPLGIRFTNQTLTYISSSTNTSSPRYTFSFTMSKAVVPSMSLTGNDMASECFYNATVFTGTLYLSAAGNYPRGSNASSTSIGGYQQWPYAIEVSQTSPGGNNIPACYELVNNQPGNQISTGLTAQSPSQQCTCDYRNYF